MPSKQDKIHLRKPQTSDGFKIHQLIANSPPLDLNSVYSYYLLSEHFRDTCVVAESQGEIAGFISAYHPPKRNNTLFVWQVVVDQRLRGKQIARRMLNALLQQLEPCELRYVEATVNPSNTASRRLFERLAIEHGSDMEETTFLDATAFGSSGNHESEILLRIPLNTLQS